MGQWLSNIDDRIFVLIVFSILIIVSLFGIKNHAFYSNNMKNAKAKQHSLNVKYKLYNNRRIDVDWINKMYGFMNIAIAVITIVVMMIVNNSTIGIGVYVVMLLIGNILVQKIIVDKYCKK